MTQKGYRVFSIKPYNISLKMPRWTNRPSFFVGRELQKAVACGIIIIIKKIKEKANV